MKRLTLLLMCLLSAMVFSQNTKDSIQIDYQNEIGLNLIDLIGTGAVELEYERFMPNNQALQFNLTLFDNYDYWEANNVEKNNAYSLMAAYRFYMGKRDYHGVFFYPYAKYMTGSIEYEERFWYADREILEVDVDNFSLGIGLGYKWLFSNRYTLTVDWNIGRTFNEELADIYSRVEGKAGISFGVMF